MSAASVAVGSPIGSTTPSTRPSSGGTTRPTFAYDALGRQTSQTDHAANGTTVALSRSASYATNGFLLSDSTSIRRYKGSSVNTRLRTY